jgi:hypothetical protein
VQDLFEAIVPDLVDVFTELANQQSFALSASSSSADKGGGSSTVQCPGGGVLSVDLMTGEAMLTDCSVGGVTISAPLMLLVTSVPPSSYYATFSGTLTVSGDFEGDVEVVEASIEWTDPATEANTSWEAMVLLDGEQFAVSDAGNGGDVAASELQLYNNLLTPREGTYNVQAPAGTRTGALMPERAVIELDLRVGDQVTIEVMGDGFEYSSTCTVAPRAAELTYVNAYLEFNPLTDVPGVPSENKIHCGCGFEEFADTNDPNVCSR